MNKSNLINIAEKLIELDQQRELVLDSKDIKAYPEGSVGIKINGQKWIVVNEDESVESKKSVNNIKDYDKSKYNQYFYFSTTGKESIVPISNANNREVLINEAYTETSYLQKELIGYDCSNEISVDEKNAIKDVIFAEDPVCNDLVVTKSDHDINPFDDFYRCNCILFKTTGNAEYKTLYVKIYKIRDKERISIVNENVDTNSSLEEMENSNTSSKYTEINQTDAIIKQQEIQNAIAKYMQREEYSSVFKVEVKAIYDLKLRKIPINISFRHYQSQVASLRSYYSTIGKEYNFYTCPTCGAQSVSSDSLSDNKLKLHVDTDMNTRGDNYGKSDSVIGCESCMTKCQYCGKWHIRLDKKNQAIQKGYKYLSGREFLYGYDIGKADKFCSCRNNINWVYDEMSKDIETDSYKKIVDGFLTKKCNLSFVNIETGELISLYDNYLEYLFSYLQQNKMFGKEKVALFFNEKYEATKNTIDTVIDTFNYILKESRKSKEDCELDATDIECFFSFDDSNNIKNNFLKDSIENYKKCLSKELNIPIEDIKITSTENIKNCSVCDGKYYSLDSDYYSDLTNQCTCCKEALDKNYKMWYRQADNVAFYKPKNKLKARRTINSVKGEMVYDELISSVLKKIAKKQ